MQEHKLNRQLPYIVADFEQPLGAGNERRTLPHPELPSRAIKVFHERRKEFNRKGLRGWAFRNLISVRNRRQRRELECYLDLHIRGLTAEPDLPVAHLVGFVQTNHGPALEVERITRAGQNFSKAQNLRGLLVGSENREWLPAALNDLMDRLESFGIFISDANYENLMWSEASDPPAFVMVDGFGDYRTTRWFAHAPWMIRRSIRKAFRAQASHWGLPWDNASGRFHINLPK